VFYVNKILSTAVRTQNNRCTIIPNINNAIALYKNGNPVINDKIYAANNTTIVSKMAILKILYLRIPIVFPGSPNRFLYFDKKGKGHVLLRGFLSESWENSDIPECNGVIFIDG
jgi:hypothetical protein